MLCWITAQEEHNAASRDEALSGDGEMGNGGQNRREIGNEVSKRGGNGNRKWPRMETGNDTIARPSPKNTILEMEMGNGLEAYFEELGNEGL